MRRLLLVVLAGCCAFAHDVVVERRGGVPQILVDGTPVRPRMFFGGPTAKTMPVKKGWQHFEQDFIVPHDYEGLITFHFRFTKVNSTTIIDDFRVIDLDTGKDIQPIRDFEGGPEEFKEQWKCWPVSVLGTLAEFGVEEGCGHEGTWGLKLKLEPQDKLWPDFHYFTAHTPIKLVRGHTIRLSVKIHSNVDTMLALDGYEPPPIPGGTFIKRLTDGSYGRQLRMAGKAGARFVTTPIRLPWPKPGEKADWEKIDEQIEYIIRENPDALVIPRINLMPPSWWHDQYPDECIGWPDRSRHGGNHYSVSSKIWLRDATEVLRNTIRHLEGKYPKNMGGYHPTGQNTNEWFYQKSWSQDHHGLSPCEINGFREWLQKKYKSNESLQKAWGRKDVDLQTISTPSIERRKTAPRNGAFLLPVVSQDVIDYNQFLQEAMTDVVLHLAKTVRQETQGKKLSVMFYGYCYEFSSMLRPSASGHYDMTRILKSPDIDVLCSPISYYDRQLGGTGQSMTASESVLNAGNIWLFEDDTSTHLSSGDCAGSVDRTKNLQDSANVVLRNSANVAIRNYAGWYMDLGRRGWFDDPRFWEELKLLECIEGEKLKNPKPYVPDVASIVDEAPMAYLDNGKGLTMPALSLSRSELSRTGISYGQYYLEDLLAGKVPAKVLLVANAWVLDGKQRAELRQAIKDKFVIWLHAPGFIDLDKRTLDPANVTEFTGFELRPMTEVLKPWVVHTTPRGKALGLVQHWQTKVIDTPAPLYSVVPKEGDEILATWPNGTAAVVLRGREIFCALPAIDRSLIRLATSLSGVWCFTNDPVVLFEQAPFMMLHGTQDGTVNLAFPNKVRISDAMTGQLLESSTDKFAIKLNFGETRILKFEQEPK